MTNDSNTEEIHEKVSIKNGVINYSDLFLDLNSRTLRVKKNEYHLRNREFILMKFLMKNPEQIFSRSQLLDRVWDRREFSKTNTVDVHVSIIRKELAKMTDKNYIKTIHCAGYMLRDNGL